MYALLTGLSLFAVGEEFHSVQMNRTSLTISSYAGSEKGFLANSYLLVGFDDAMLVDAQLLKSEAKHVVHLIKNSGKKLTTVFVTHDHPDHYLGLALIHAAFPEAKIIATPAVAAAIKKKAPGAIEKWQDEFKADLPTDIVVPEAYAKDSIDFGGDKIKIVPLQAGESENAAALYVPSLKVLIAGDAVFNNVHLYLAEHHPDGWLKNLEKLKAIGKINNIMPGHGLPGGTELIDANKKYIETFEAAPKNKATCVEKMKTAYPDYKMPELAERSCE